jgi:hypothetical protein
MYETQLILLHEKLTYIIFINFFMFWVVIKVGSATTKSHDNIWNY